MLHTALAVGMLLAGLALPPRPADAWQLRVGSNLHSPGGDVAIDSRGDVVGSTERRVGSKRFPEVVKLSAERGRQQWRRSFDDDRAYINALETTADDDVIAVVQLGPVGKGFSVVRLAAADGSVVWRHDVAAMSRRDRFADLTLDPAGDVIVGAGIDDRIVVLALRGTDGTERWRSELLTPLARYVSANEVAVAPDGDVVVAGDTSAPGAVVARLDGSTGATRWTRDFPHLGDPRGLAVDRDGTVAFGAYFAVVRQPLNPNSRFTVVLLGASGELTWERRIEPADGRSTGGYVAATAFLPDGDVVATGSVDDDVATVRLARTTGDVVWRHDLDGEPGLLARTPDGDLVVGADVFNGRTCWDFVLLDLSSTTGTERGRRRMRGRAANDHSGCSSGVNDDGLRALAVSDLGVAIAARVGDPRGPRRLIARFPLVR